MITRMLSIVLLALVYTITTAVADLMIVGIDEKVTFESGITYNLPDEGKDLVLVVDITNGENPKITASIPLKNSIFGPPTNLIITPDEKLALVANPVVWVEKDGQWGPSPDTMLHVISLEGTPRYIRSIKVGKQPSGMDLTPDGSLLLIANRAEPSISVVAIEGTSVRLIDTVTLEYPSDAVSMTPNGKRALFTMRTENKVGILHIDGSKVTYDPAEDINVGIEPYNIAVSPKGDIALVNNIGQSGGNDGNTDTVCVIDLTAAHPHVIDWVAVGDGPEGLAISPKGDLAISVLINGSQSAESNPNTAWAAHRNGAVAVLKINGKKVTKIKEIEVGGGMPEGVVLSPDGRYIYVGNFLGDNVTILKVEGETVVDTGKELILPGSPASMRGLK